MTAIFTLVLVMAALAAAGFAVWPVLRAHQVAWRARILLAGATAAFVLAIGLGAYLTLGSPQLAMRPAPDRHDLRKNDPTAIIAILTQRVHQAPRDTEAWMWLGKMYMTLRDPQDAAAAFRRGLAVAPAKQQSEFSSAYGTALTLSAAGAVTPEAQQAFEDALKGDPKDHAARYFLGLAHAARGDNAAALALWQGLLADVPASNPLHGELVDRIAALTARSGTAPNIGAMVEALAERLRRNPDDAEGWQRLVRAYVVLGDMAKANAAYADGRRALVKDPAALAALDAEALQLKLK